MASLNKISVFSILSLCLSVCLSVCLSLSRQRPTTHTLQKQLKINSRHVREGSGPRGCVCGSGGGGHHQNASRKRMLNFRRGLKAERK